jgi:Big-like domain-containing protein
MSRRLLLFGLAAGCMFAAAPATASAAAPTCDASASVYALPAGLSHANPEPLCEDADGDPISIEVVTPPTHGTLDPAGAAPIDTVRTYTADAGAAGQEDTMTFHAVAGGETSNDFSITVNILEANHAPVCDDAAVEVQSGESVAIPACTDADPGDTLTTTVVHAPEHGTYDEATGMYTPAAGFTGDDSMTLGAEDAWEQSGLGVITITVTAAPQQPPVTPPVKPKPKPQSSPKPDLTAPSLALATRTVSRRTVSFTATTNEAGKLVLQVLVDRRTARRLKLKRHPATAVVVGSLTRDLAAGSRTVRVKLTDKARARLKGATGVELRLVARLTDAAGNVRTERMRFPL